MRKEKNGRLVKGRANKDRKGKNEKSYEFFCPNLLIKRICFFTRNTKLPLFNSRPSIPLICYRNEVILDSPFLFPSFPLEINRWKIHLVCLIGIYLLHDLLKRNEANPQSKKSQSKSTKLFCRLKAVQTGKIKLLCSNRKYKVKSIGTQRCRIKLIKG